MKLFRALGIGVLACASGCFAQLMQQQKECKASVASLQALPAQAPAFDFSGRWSCIFEGTDGSNGTESLEIVQSGPHATVSSRDGYGAAAVLDGRIAGRTLVMTRAGDSLTVRVDGSPRLLQGVIDSGEAGDCRQRRYTCNRRR